MDTKEGIKYILKCKELERVYAEARRLRNEIHAIEVDEIEAYGFLYNNKSILENALASIKEHLAVAKDGLIAYLDRQGVGGIKREGRTFSLSHRVFPKVEDFDTLALWVKEQDDPQNIYLDVKFNVKKLSSIIKDARVNHPGEEKDFLPPGLSFSVKEIITVRTVAPARTTKETS